MEQPLNKSPRIEAVDALRGFAVMAIILVHNLEHFIYPVYPANPPHWLAVLDQGVLSAVFGNKEAQMRSKEPMRRCITIYGV